MGTDRNIGESSASKTYRLLKRVGPEELVSAIETATAHSRSPEHMRVDFRLGSNTEERVRSPIEAATKARKLGKKVKGLWIWTEPFSLDADLEKGRVTIVAVGPTLEEAHLRLSDVKAALANSLMLEEVEGEVLLPFESESHIHAKLYRQTVMDAATAITQFDTAARTQFWVHRRDEPHRDPVPLSFEELGEVLRTQWQNIGRLDIEVLGAALHAFLKIYLADTWLQTRIYVPEKSQRHTELLEALSAILELKPISLGYLDRKGTITYSIKNFDKGQLLLGLRGVESELTGEDIAARGPQEDLLPKVDLIKASYTRQIEKNSDPNIRVPMDVLESFSTIDDFHEGLGKARRILRSVEYSVVGSRERKFDLRVNVTDGIMTAWSNVEPSELVKLVSRIGEYLDIDAIEGRPGAADADETPFIMKALEVAKPFFGIFPMIPKALIAIGGPAVIATAIFASAEVAVTHPVSDGSTFEIPRPGPVSVSWQRIPPWWSFLSERSDHPATVTVYRYGAPHGDVIENAKPGWLFDEGPGRYRIDIDVDGAILDTVTILVADPDAKAAEE